MAAVAADGCHHHHSRQPRPGSGSGSSRASSASSDGNRQGLPRHHHRVPPTASPEIISSLITSLSASSSSAATAVGSPDPTLSLPTSPVPSSGSFGVDYGAYNRPVLAESVSLDELAACPPVVRTSKHPSGFSSLATAHRSASHEGALGLRSLIRSRPSSRGSVASKNDDAPLGNRSIDATAAKRAAASKPLMYASSSERLREQRGHDRRRVSATQTAIREEPHDQSPPPPHPPRYHQHQQQKQRPVPNRDSSLQDARRSSRPCKAVAEEADERAARSGRIGPGSAAGTSFLLGLEEDFPAPPRPTPVATPTKTSRRTTDRTPNDDDNDEDDNSAPYPSVSSGRRHRRRSRRSENSVDRSFSGRQSPTTSRDAAKPRRSRSRLQRLSAGPRSPRSESRLSFASPEPLQHTSPTERPGSADSVDDAVDSYLSSPRLSQKIRHPQTGRVVSFSEVGDENGSAVFCCVGMGLTRYITAFYDELAVTLKLRLITPDRPGVGDSDPLTDGTATPLGWPDDVYAICQALKITKFSILAHSAGAIYALATALRMPQHIRGRIHLLAPWIPPSQMNVFGSTQTMPPNNAIPTSQKILRALPTPILKAANSSFMTATSSSITSSLPKNPRRGTRRKTSRNSAPDAEDAAATEGGGGGGATAGGPELVTATENMDRVRPPDSSAALTNSGSSLSYAADRARQLTYDTRLTHAIWELATTGANPAVDLLVCLERRHAIGFRYVDITRPVVIHHGSRDSRVPVDNVKWLGKMMRRCEVRVLEGEGHGLMASAQVMGSVLMEMSKEWEDWIRATGGGGGGGGGEGGAGGGGKKKVGGK
ncbi:hypothetical protein CP532_6951 [Ophiocordyceps camponoti-leonardi (nom. inval.)]|nr:hypothetical protein CP532_6951 [Ophiocordyceps camponoti-leonardi (nom. inval.)]